MTINAVTLSTIIDDCASERDIPLQMSTSAALLDSEWIARETMDIATKLNDVFARFVPLQSRNDALIAALDVVAHHRVRLTAVLVAAAHRMGQADWLEELAEIKDERAG